MNTPKPISLVQVIQHYRGLPHQIAAIHELDADLKANGYPVAMDRSRPWFITWNVSQLRRLTVPYFSQMDNQETAVDGPGWRQCASSSCAMLAAFWGKVTPDQKGEARYIAIRTKHGPTTDPMAHVAALTELGLVAKFQTNGSRSLLRFELNEGRPVAVGWLHHGPVSAPSGGGHWSVATGYNSTEFYHNDPYGEANLTAGGYVSTAVGAGKGISYSAANWLPRWTPKGNDGWMITVRQA